MNGYIVRALQAADADASRALITNALGGSRHEGRALELFESALRGDGEDAGRIALDERSGITRGISLSGVVAGAVRATRVHLLVATSPAAYRALATDIVATTSSDRIRIVIAEVPDEPAFADMMSALRGAGFGEEGHVADWFADGAGLRLLSARPG